jgi:hypothetical protein
MKIFTFANTPYLVLLFNVFGYLDGKVRNRPTRPNEIGSEEKSKPTST